MCVLGYLGLPKKGVPLCNYQFSLFKSINLSLEKVHYHYTLYDKWKVQFQNFWILPNFEELESSVMNTGIKVGCARIGGLKLAKTKITFWLILILHSKMFNFKLILTSNIIFSNLAFWDMIA